MFKFLNQCFARLRFWKSVSDSRNLLDGATAVLLETLFQNRSRAKHWFKNLNILVTKTNIELRTTTKVSILDYALPEIWMEPYILLFRRKVALIIRKCFRSFDVWPSNQNKLLEKKNWNIFFILFIICFTTSKWMAWESHV